MTRSLERRGPDGEGIWVDPEVGIALGHRRLAIVDLSPTGAQPMASPTGRYIAVTNGEIYDHRRRRAELEAAGVTFRGTSDTEVLLAAIERWGVVDALRRLNGMFALAVWDRQERCLMLARDRMGEKPLYWGRVGRSFVFASRPMALRAVPGFNAELDEAAVGAFLRLGFVPHPHTIYANLSQVAPGELVTLRPGSDRVEVRKSRWWSLEEVATTPARRRVSPQDALDELDELVRDSVALRLQADVPTGAFLSGGIDSSLVAAVAQSVGAAPLRTFTVAVGSSALDESARATAIARHLGTEHTTIELSDDEAARTVAEMTEAYDEPFADPSAMPTLLLCREVRRHVKVALGGDGGDELFAGYNRHVVGARAWTAAGRLPAPVRHLGAEVLTRTPRAMVDRTGQAVARVRRRDATPHLGDKLVKLGELLKADRADGPWSALAPAWPGRLPWLRGSATADPVAPARLTGALDQLRWLDTTVTLPDDMLVKIDRASMHWALETRVPLLDPRIVEWAWAQPSDTLVAGGQGKVVVRRLLDRYVPEALTRGPKRGFDPPLAAWLRGPLRAWADERLEPERLARTGWLDPSPIQALWREHLRHEANHDYRLWTVLSFVTWLERWGPDAT